MPTKPLLIAAALFQDAYGAALLFFPEEAGRLFLVASTEAFFAQQFGTALLGFAALNWVARGSALGSVYGRAVVVGNLVFFVANGLLLFGRAFSTPQPFALWVHTAIAAALTSGFALLLFRSPTP